MRALSMKTIEKAIYPVGFYKNKTKQILAICQSLLRDFGGRVPDTIEELLTLKGVGRKTANLVVTVGYRKPGISWISTFTGSVTGGATFRPGPLKKPNALFDKNCPQNIGSRLMTGWFPLGNTSVDPFLRFAASARSRRPPRMSSAGRARPRPRPCDDGQYCKRVGVRTSR